MKRVVAGLLAGVLTVSLLAGCSKQLTPEEQAASEAAVLAQQLQDEEDQTGLKRLISNNITEYEQPFYDFVESLQEGDADKAATALGVPNTFGSNLQNWVIVNNYETFQKNELQHICFNSAKDGAAAVLNVYLKYPGEVTKDTSPDYVMNVDYVDGAWSLTPPTGVVKDYAFTTPTNKVSFEGTDLSSYASKSAETDVWTITLPRALDFEDGSTYVVTNDMGDFNAHIYDIKSDGKVMHQPSHAFRLLGGRAMIAIRVCPICKKAFEGRVGVPKVYCDECTMLSDYAAIDTARSQAAWFFEDFGDEDEREDEKHESEQETDTAPLITITDESKLPKATRQSRESLLELISSRKRS